MKKDKKLPTITLLGQAASGKTNLLTAFLNHNPSWLDLEDGPDFVQNFSVSEMFTSGSEEERAFDYLRTHYASLLAGKENLLEGTNAARRYGIKMSFHQPAQAKVQKSGWLGIPSLSSSAPAREEELEFSIVDGRGADAAPVEMIQSDDKDATARRQEYRDGMDDSSGFVLFMPLMSDDEGTKAIISQRFLGEITESLRRKREKLGTLPKLQRIALCFTKCERAFMNDGVYAAESATEMARYDGFFRGNAVLSTFRSLLADSLKDDTFDMRVFPVSTYGFVRNSGSPNFYPWPSSPGLLTRAVDPIDDYDDIDMPDYKDHFPIALKDDQARSLWRPFNIAPPLLYALTGRITGPVSFSADRALAHISD